MWFNTVAVKMASGRYFADYDTQMPRGKHPDSSSPSAWILGSQGAFIHIAIPGGRNDIRRIWKQRQEVCVYRNKAGAKGRVWVGSTIQRLRKAS